MVKTKFKKAVSLMLAAVMSLTAFMGIGATTAFAAVGEKADVIPRRLSPKRRYQ